MSKKKTISLYIGIAFALLACVFQIFGTFVHSYYFTSLFGAMVCILLALPPIMYTAYAKD